MEAIDELISAAQTFYDDARANENGRSRDARTDPSPDCDYLSLHLAFYLASWGMYRGSCFLLQKDYKVLSPVVEKVLKPEYDCLFGLACTDVRNGDVWKQLKNLSDDIGYHFWPIRNEVAGREVASPVSPVLITKILMGTLGCVPAYDRFFEEGARHLGLEKKSYNEDSLLELADIYEAHNDRLEDARRGMRTDDLIYPQMKLLDMGFWQVGFEKDAGSAR